MNRNDILRIAEEAGFESNSLGMTYTSGSLSDLLERFAVLVAAAERERIIAANAPEIEKVNGYIKALEDAVAAEREACAVVCDKLGDEFADANAADCASAIRERGAP